MLDQDSCATDSASECKDCPVGATTIYAQVLAKDANVVSGARQSVLHVRAHQLINRTGDRIDLVYTLKEGWACRFVQFADGRRQILAFLLPGDTLCAEAIPVADYSLPYSIRALTDVTLCGFDPPQLRELALACREHRELFARYILRQMEFVDGRLSDVGRRRALGSLAHLIIELYDRLSEKNLSDGDQIPFPLRQEDLADALGLTPAHVNRTMVDLRRRGLIELTAQRMRVHDMAALRRVAHSN